MKSADKRPQEDSKEKPFEGRQRIVPLNLPAGLTELVAGNPVTTRLESAPANCFPGLDVDIRNLDRRFFPGLVFEFVNRDDNDPQVGQRGALLVDVDPADPDLTAKDRELKKQLAVLAGMLSGASILLDSVSQTKEAEVHRIDLMYTKDGKRIPQDWDVTWRTVRSLEPGPLTITLSRFDGAGRVPLMQLTGHRRVYQTPHGSLPSVYRPGELTQSLCSPWQHDFRECSCTYWASNHPDIVMAAHPADIAEMDDEGADQERAEDPVVWMRWDREKRVAPRPTGDGSRALEMDHYETNRRWSELNFVLEGREQLTPWVLSTIEEPEPLPIHEMLTKLETLAAVEQALALEYLYARYTVHFYGELTGETQNQAVFIAHELLNIAIGEMMHLRWVNDLLTRMQALVGQPAIPALNVGPKVPKGKFVRDKGRNPIFKVEWRRVMQRSIDVAIADFEAAEAPSGTLEGQYAQILVRLRQGWPRSKQIHPELIELVERIIADGMEHYLRFREMRSLLERPGGHKLVKALTNLAPGSKDFNRAAELYGKVIDGLSQAYGPGGSGQPALAAREAMRDLDQCAQDFAREGKAIPFLDIAKGFARRRKARKPVTAGAAARRVPKPAP